MRAIALAVLLLLSGCGAKAAAENDELPLPTSSSTTAPADPFAVPAVIDQPYIQRVIDVLFQAQVPVQQDSWFNHQMTQADYDTLDDIYDDVTLKIQRKLFSDQSSEDSPGMKNPTGAEVIDIKDVRVAKSDCIAFDADIDSRALFIGTPPPDTTQLIVLDRVPAVHGHNPTHWKIFIYDRATDYAGPQC